MQEPYIDVDVNGVSYRIGRISAPTGAWILSMLLTAFSKHLPEGSEEPQKEPSQEERVAFAKGLVMALWVQAGSELDEATHMRVQQHCLKLCAREGAAGHDAVMMKDGRWAIKELEYDIPVVAQLVSEALQFNLAPFFIGGALNPQPGPSR